MLTARNRIEESIESECLLRGISKKHITQGRVTGGKLFAISGCSPDAVRFGVSVAENMAREDMSAV